MNLEKVVDTCKSNNLIAAIVFSLTNLGGLEVVDVVNKVVCFGHHGVIVFQGLKTSVIV